MKVATILVLIFEIGVNSISPISASQGPDEFREISDEQSTGNATNSPPPPTTVPTATVPTATVPTATPMASSDAVGIRQTTASRQLNEPNEKLPQLNFVVDVLAVLTTVLALVSGYSVYKSHRDSNEAKRVASNTLTEAKASLEESRLTLDRCTEIKGRIETAEADVLARLKSENSGITDEIRLGRLSLEKNMKDNITTFESELMNYKSEFEGKMKAELELFKNHLYEARTINRTKAKLVELLSNNNPDPEVIYPMLTEVLDYPDQRSFEIYEQLLDVFPADRDIVTKVRMGLQIFRERHYPRGTIG